MEVTFCLADVNIIADVELIFLNNIWIHINRDLILNAKSITNFVWWSEQNIKFQFFATCSYISIKCFLLCREILPKNSKQMKISFLSEMVLEDFRLMNSLSKKILIQLSIKKSGNEFLCQIIFKYLISLCKTL